MRLRIAMMFCSAILLFAAVLAMAPALHAVDSGACIAGSISSPLKIEVFSDYQCPACRQFYLTTMRTIIPEYADSGKACVIYREFPLPMHNHAKEAARYGYAAMQLGVKQWELVTDALFMNQDAKGIIEIARKETDPKMKRAAVERLSNIKSKEATDYMMEVLNK